MMNREDFNKVRILLKEAQSKIKEAIRIINNSENDVCEISQAKNNLKEPTARIVKGAFNSIDNIYSQIRTGSLILHNYRVLSTLAKNVFKVENLETGEIEVAKRVDKLDSIRVKELYNSNNLHNKINEKNIEGIHKIVETATDIYGISRYIPGENLADYIITHTQLSYQETLEYFVSILQLVKKLHSKNIIHRDLKPENFIVDMDNNLHLIDLDIALETKNDYATIECAIGTKQYSAPETYTIGESITYTSDIYSIGKIAENIFLSTDYSKEIYNIWQKCQNENENFRFKNIDEILRTLNKGM